MFCIEWKETFLIGIPELDQHHEHLIDLLNRAYTACMLNNPMDDLVLIVQELVEYTKYHFAAEERVMQDHCYPGLCEQIKQHEQFVSSLDGLIGKLEDKNASSTIELVELTEFLAAWIRDHIITLDSLFGAFLKQPSTT